MVLDLEEPGPGALPCGTNAHFSQTPIIIAYMRATKGQNWERKQIGRCLIMSTASRGKSPAQLFRHLSAKWPAAFNPKAPRPLKIGIHHDIRALDDELSDDELGRALRAYTRMARYLARLDAGAARVDLDGEPAGEVSDADAATAKALLCRKDKQERKQTPEPRAEPEAPPKPKPKQTALFKAKSRADSPTGIVVETKRRRSFRKPMA
ncbi:ProQ/FinO family protein [Mesorhizobium sp. AR07]|uniref:ProQ/FinO family protein n=1 Tax=Mesorhizobium sp. AR07 TaxID=2865838 RepID=UPI00215E6FF4|nr:ProQ/FinO family protein [Mesorhizobium sp. AR07]